MAPSAATFVRRLRALVRPVRRSWSSSGTPPSPEPAARDHDRVLTLILALLDDKADILSCSLVCRAWIGPARSFLAFRVWEKDFSLFSARNAQLPGTAQHLRLTKLAKSTSNLSELSGFRVLKSLDLHMNSLPQSLPHLPSLEHLMLKPCAATMTRVQLEQFLGNLPALRRLYLDGGSLSSHISNTAGGQPRRPLITLDVLSLEGEFSRDVLYALRTRRLSLSAPFSPFSASATAYCDVISEYLRGLGEELTALIVTSGLDQLCNLDLSRSSSVRHLGITLHVNGANNIFDIEPYVQSFLVRAAKSCALESITLYIIGCVVGGYDASRISLTKFGEFFKTFMQTPRTRGVRKLEVHIRGDKMQGMGVSSGDGRLYECNPDLPARQRLVASLMMAMPEDGWSFDESGDRRISFLLFPSKAFYGL
ncbi:hypothetical protein GGX14DRAFT_645142 [Mycena pura]|uniref:F-box domain-containing protein n=1 Tax=Mycena pura TaxID=153505 RepID=A0AAD6V881_9AGAR|nr:hypothetical protein GGX14DRAFT_645142 [Mycena pura]